MQTSRLNSTTRSSEPPVFARKNLSRTHLLLLRGGRSAPLLALRVHQRGLKQLETLTDRRHARRKTFRLLASRLTTSPDHTSARPQWSSSSSVSSSIVSRGRAGFELGELGEEKGVRRPARTLFSNCVRATPASNSAVDACSCVTARRLVGFGTQPRHVRRSYCPQRRVRMLESSDAMCGCMPLFKGASQRDRMSPHLNSRQRSRELLCLLLGAVQPPAMCHTGSKR